MRHPEGAREGRVEGCGRERPAGQQARSGSAMREGASAGVAARRYGPVPAAAEPPRHIHASRPVLVCLGQGLGKRPALNPRPTPVAPGRNARGARPEGAWARPAKPCSRSVGRAFNLFGSFCQGEGARVGRVPFPLRARDGICVEAGSKFPSKARENKLAKVLCQLCTLCPKICGGCTT